MTTTCDNPACTCSPCTCVECRCGGPALGRLERRVMDVLWASPARAPTGRDVADALPEYAYTTIATVLDRLIHKGLVDRSRDKHVYRYAVTESPETYTAMAMHAALAASGDPSAALARFAQTMSPSEAALLRRALQDQP